MSTWDSHIAFALAAAAVYVIFLIIVLRQARALARRNGRLGAIGTRRLALQMSIAAALFWVLGLGQAVLRGELSVAALLITLPVVVLLQVGAAHYWARLYKVR